ncbi:hypothetical protein [Streptomyces sp. NPDC012888]|uniref:hypothetical protein n=1 Tax=Streptomyces sp. NPDC012888 TaxID=3364855 RepID=UPI0036740484
MNREQPVIEAFVSHGDTAAGDVDPLTLLRRLVGHRVELREERGRRHAGQRAVLADGA